MVLVRVVTYHKGVEMGKGRKHRIQKMKMRKRQQKVKSRKRLTAKTKVESRKQNLGKKR